MTGPAAWAPVETRQRASVARVAIVKNWDSFWITDDAFMAQQPQTMQCEFRLGYTRDCDYLVVLNRARQPVRTELPRSHVWGVIQEPPNEIFRDAHRGQRCMGRVYNQCFGQGYSPRHHLAPPLVPYFVGKSWPSLASGHLPEKSATLSCITSKTFFYRGHEQRIAFLEVLKASGLSVDLFGRGIRPVADKFEALGPYKYSLVLENFSHPHYWTEKFADAVLSNTFPIYFGCPNLEDYFPADSFARLDVARPHEAVERIREVVEGGLWERRQDALAEARHRVLTRYGFFSFLDREIAAHDAGLPKDAALEGRTVVRPYSWPIIACWMRSYARKYRLKLAGRKW